MYRMKASPFSYLYGQSRYSWIFRSIFRLNRLSQSSASAGAGMVCSARRISPASRPRRYCSSWGRVGSASSAIWPESHRSTKRTWPSSWASSMGSLTGSLSWKAFSCRAKALWAFSHFSGGESRKKNSWPPSSQAWYFLSPDQPARTSSRRVNSMLPSYWKNCRGSPGSNGQFRLNSESCNPSLCSSAQLMLHWLANSSR